MYTKIAVLKFGSSVLSNIDNIPQAVHEVYHYQRQGYKVLVVVSAIGNHTEKLIAQTKQVLNDETIAAPDQEFSELLATGETVAASLFTIGLDKAGIKAKKLDHRYVLTQGSFLNADPLSLEKEQIVHLFETNSVLVLPGFIGCNDKNELTLLGRGGSDLTAIFCAWALAADLCVIYKDTAGLYDCDPNLHNANAKRYQRLNYIDALRISSGAIQHKALKFAQHKNLCFYVKSLSNINGSTVGKTVSHFYPKTVEPKKLRVSLLGLGTVGFGVYQHLLANPELFEITGIAVKHLDKHLQKNIPSQLISDNVQDIIARECDVVIELIGGIELPYLAITQLITQKRHIITANKALLNRHGLVLEALAQQHQVSLFYSAAVAGAVPILETLRNDQVWKKTGIKSISAILNGTCNFILDKVQSGKSFNEALRLAKILGFAESDPSLDLSGQDAADKLVLICRQAFGKDPDYLTVSGIQTLNEEFIQTAKLNKQTVRLIAHCQLENQILTAEIKPRLLDLDHPLAQVCGVDNAIVIQSIDKQITKFYGKGAGRWPTSEAIFADLLDLSKNHQQQSSQNFISDTSTHFRSTAYESLDTTRSF